MIKIKQNLYNETECNIAITNNLFASYFNSSQKELRNSVEKYFNYSKEYSYHIENADKFISPPISHYIWLTYQERPKEIKDSDLDNIYYNLNIIKENSFSPSDWQHILWVNDKNLIPETIKKTINSDLVIKEISEIKSSLVSYNLAMRMFEQKHLGLSVDIIRMDLLNLYGGFYADLNYKIKYSPESLMRSFNFIVESEVENPLDVENNMIISSPGHPITKIFLEKAVKENLVEQTIEKYQNCGSEIFADMLSWGMFRISVVKDFMTEPYKNLLVIDNNKNDPYGNLYCHKTDRNNELTQIFYQSASDLIEEQSLCNIESFGDDSKIDSRSWVD